MRTLIQQVFDRWIGGSSGVWHTSPDLEGLLGQSDFYAIQASITNLEGVLPKLTVLSEHSSDGKHWAPTGTTEIDNVLMLPDAIIVGASASDVVLGARLRFRITLSGSNPRCRLKLFFTGRATGGSEQGRPRRRG